MFALGCIQALRCNTNHCPTGVTTQLQALARGLHVGDKADRVANYHAATVKGFLELLAAMGVEHPDDLGPSHVYRRIDDFQVHSFRELYDFLEDGQLVHGNDAPAGWRADWQRASAEEWRY